MRERGMIIRRAILGDDDEKERVCCGFLGRVGGRLMLVYITERGEGVGENWMFV